MADYPEMSGAGFLPLLRGGVVHIFNEKNVISLVYATTPTRKKGIYFRLSPQPEEI
jgi:hypothetical protein